VTHPMASAQFGARASNQQQILALALLPTLGDQSSWTGGQLRSFPRIGG